MTALPQQHPTSEVPLAPDEPTLRRYEFQILGHLLGRKDGAAGIARAVGVSPEHAARLCDALCARGKLCVTLGPQGPAYRVSSGERRR